MGTSYVSLTTQKLWVPRKEAGSDITWQPVERYFNKRKYDFLGFADYIYLENDETVAVQIGGPGTHKAHKEKILAEPRARQWFFCRNRIELITWSKKLVKRGGKAKVWVPKIEEITFTQRRHDDGKEGNENNSG